MEMWANFQRKRDWVSTTAGWERLKLAAAATLSGLLAFPISAALATDYPTAAARSIGVDANGTCEGTCDLPDPLPIGTSTVGLPARFNTTLDNGDTFQIFATPLSSNVISPGYSSPFSVEYLGNAFSGGPSQNDNVTVRVSRSYETNSSYPLSLGTNHSATFSSAIASGSTVSATDSSNGAVFASYGPGSSTSSFSQSRFYQISASSGAVPLTFTFDSNFAAGSPVGSYIEWNGGTIPPSANSILNGSISVNLAFPRQDQPFVPVYRQIQAAFTPSNGELLSDAAADLGFQDFDWIQTITIPSPSPFYSFAGVNLVGTFNDPPRYGGYATDRRSGGDFAYPFYLDPVGSSADDYLGNEESLNTLFFRDTPADDCLAYGTGIGCGATAPFGTYLRFTTELVGIKAGFVPYTDCIAFQTCTDLGVGFDWIDDNSGTVGGISLLKGNLLPDDDSGEGGITILGVRNITSFGQLSVSTSIPEPSSFFIAITSILIMVLSPSLRRLIKIRKPWASKASFLFWLSY